MTFRCTDNRTGKPRTITVTGEEFLRRYLQHVLPKGSQRLRYYGLWSPARRQTLRTLQLLLAAAQSHPRPHPANRPSRRLFTLLHRPQATLPDGPQLIAFRRQDPYGNRCPGRDARRNPQAPRRAQFNTDGAAALRPAISASIAGEDDV